MNELIQKLARQRMSIEKVRTHRDSLKSMLAASDLGVTLETVEAMLKQYQSDAADLESQIRTAALLVYAANGSRRPHLAVTVKEFTVLEYDANDALNYSRQYIHTALKLDVKVFEKAAVVLQLPFVTERVEPRVQIATDLNAWAEMEEVAE